VKLHQSALTARSQELRKHACDDRWSEWGLNVVRGIGEIKSKKHESYELIDSGEVHQWMHAV
jgi:hypothetical protein